MIVVYVVIIFLKCMNAVYLEDYEEETNKKMSEPAAPPDDLEFEPVMTLTKDKEKLKILKNINCDDFSRYAVNCTVEAALMYNSSRKAPPMPVKIADWCKAIRHLTNCAIDWNSDCREVTESYFNEESIRGHMHVVTNVCDDEWFLNQYNKLPRCINAAKDAWEHCYTTFKTLVDEQKNTSQEWTHFETHFYMCCARGQFRRCTLDAVFDMPAVCPYDQAVTLQKFSIIVSEGDVFQDCDHNMLYTNCPGGDPRPTSNTLGKFMSIHDPYLHETKNHSSHLRSDFFVFMFCIVYFIYFIFMCGFIK